MSKLWNRVDTIIGHEAHFDIPCEFCKEDMFLRYSQICAVPYKNEQGYILGYNSIEYKCSLCGNTVVFCVEDTPEYLQELLDKRQGIALYYPPKEEWASINERHRKKLESLGYL